MQEWWFLRFVEKLLEGDAPTRRLLSRRNPFADAPPAFVRGTGEALPVRPTAMKITQAPAHD